MQCTRCKIEKRIESLGRMLKKICQIISKDLNLAVDQESKNRINVFDYHYF